MPATVVQLLLQWLELGQWGLGRQTQSPFRDPGSTKHLGQDLAVFLGMRDSEQMHRLRMPIQRGNNSHHNTNTDEQPEELSLGPELEQRASKILALLKKLEQSIRDLMSVAWEQEYERRDMLEEMQGLNQLLQETIAMIGPPELSQEAASALAKYLDERVLVEKSRNWELGYQCRDLQEDLLKLQLQLRSSVPVKDIAHPPWKERTAMEKAMADRIVELEDRLRNPKGRGRSCSV